MGAINVADILTMQDLANGHLDVKALGEAANGDENTIVTTRTGNTYPSAERAINIMFQNGGLPATPFATKALMTASPLVDGKYAMVTDDTVNNGLYVKTAGAWVKSAYDPLAQAKTYTNSAIIDDRKTVTYLEGLSEDIKLLLNQVPNQEDLLNGVSKTAGFYIGANGNLSPFSSYSYTDYMSVLPSDEYVISHAGRHVGAFYDAQKQFLSPILAPTSTELFNFAFNVPANATYMRLNVDSRHTVTLIYARNTVGKINIPTKSAWMNRKVAWFGTSIPAGQPHQDERDKWSYANLAVHDLGGSIKNKCVGGSGMASTTANSFVSTSSAINYQNSLVSLINTPNEPDLVVFDFGVNDYFGSTRPSILNFDPLDPLDSGNTGTKTKIDTRDVTKFIGAFNTVIDAMLAANPRMRFALITHFSSDDAQQSAEPTKDFYKQLNMVIESIADYWSAPVLSVYKKSNLRKRNGVDSITPAMPDKIHPASGDGRAVETLRNIVRDFLISIA